jgi:hypothetical protein
VLISPNDSCMLRFYKMQYTTFSLFACIIKYFVRTYNLSKYNKQNQNRGDRSV